MVALPVPPIQLLFTSPKPNGLSNADKHEIVGSVVNKLLFSVIIEVNNWKSLEYSLVISGTVFRTREHCYLSLRS